MNDRRQQPRFDVRGTATLLVRHNAGTAFSIESISQGGARLVGPLTLEVGERVQLLFELEGTPIDVEGVVVRAERQDIINDRVAIKFAGISEPTRAAIHRLVVSALDQESDEM